MATSESADMIVNGIDFDCNTDYKYTKPKLNTSGGKNVGILSTKTQRALFLSTPCMLTWGVNEYVDEGSGRKTYDMTLQFPKDEYMTENTSKFLANMVALQNKLKDDALKYSKDWLGKAKMSKDVIDALWSPMLKYPKDPDTGEPDENRPPTLRIKFQYWEGEWKCELYDVDQKLLFPNDDGQMPMDLVQKATQVATIIQCGGLWFVNGKFGVTWKFVQAVVKPKESLRGKCFINLSGSDKATMAKDSGSDEPQRKMAVADSSDDDDDNDDEEEDDVEHAATNSGTNNDVVEASNVLAAEVRATLDAAAPKKKVVRRKKGAE